MKVMQKCDKKVRVMNETNKTKKKIELSLFLSVSHIVISDFSIILSIASTLKNTSLKTLIFNLMIQNFTFNK